MKLSINTSLEALLTRYIDSHNAAGHELFFHKVGDGNGMVFVPMNEATGIWWRCRLEQCGYGLAGYRHSGETSFTR